ncbi:class I SAM-dependent methyltransferase [Ramlibacter sp.]|uniref:class I SAM-dependent methyltransferase n=1 Tax=Ramlibacter sp. TaxID=1917967 RepID=UPI0026045FE8|nr:class I SAM-dependent methyltransferase [Ramlibacter sp.]MDB5954976.1 class SAM-dependent methyltransferase [Ramlibacter sp.]
MRDECTIDGWPAGSIERLGACPLCAATARSCLHEGLTDRLFGTPGEWRLHACGQCGIAYLDPRPNAKEIHRAYARYFTHADDPLGDPQQPGTTWIQSLQLAVLRAYLRRHFGRVVARPSDSLALVMRLFPDARSELDGAMRGVARPHPGDTVLDIGCGSGRFLAWARFAGWKGMGTEVDPDAATRARAKGFEVHEGPLEELLASGRKFEAITIGHVIEHVYDPRAVLRTARQLLQPGGHFWIETPNIAAHGHQCFGARWRGLEPPRHLQIFTPEVLRALLEEAGFDQVRFAPWRGEWQWMANASREGTRAPGLARALFRGSDPDERVGRDDPRKREFITLTATVTA